MNKKMSSASVGLRPSDPMTRGFAYGHGGGSSPTPSLHFPLYI